MTVHAGNSPDHMADEVAGWAEFEAVRERARRFETYYDGGARRIVWRQWGSGEPVLMLHGGSGSWNHWVRTIPALESDYALWLPDIPGLGDSDAPALPVDFAEIAAHIADGFTELASPRAPARLVVFSLGGQFAVPIAIQRPDLLRQVVLVGCNVFRPLQRSDLALRNWRNATDEDDRGAIIRENLKAVMLHNDAAIDPLAIALQTENLRRRQLSAVKATNNRPLCEALHDLPADIRIDAINGADDFILYGRPDLQEQALHRLRSDARLRLPAGGSHWAMYDSAPAFNAELRELLA